VTLLGFFDESERRLPTEPITVAGYLFKPTRYKQFVRRWGGVLRLAGGVDHLHMTDLFAGEKAFDGLSIARRAEVFAEAVTVINDHMTAAVGISFLQSEFEAAAPANWPNLFGSIYNTACQMCVEMSGAWLMEHHRGEHVKYVFEAGHKFQHEADAALKVLGADAAHRRKGRYLSHGFKEKIGAVGLQAADVLAWAATKEEGWNHGDRILDPFLRTLRAMASDRTRYEVKLVTRGALGEYFRLQQESIARGDRHLVVEVPPHKRTFR
jgi:hypothetical protein